MKKLFKCFLILEVLVCFTPVLLLLLLGGLWVVVSLATGLFATAMESEGLRLVHFIPLALAYIFSICGLIGLSDVIKRIVERSPAGKAPRHIRAFVAMGFIPLACFLVYFMIDEFTWSGILLVVFPLVCAIHVLYLGRYYLLGSSANKRS